MITRQIYCIALLAALGACSSLPRDGPSNMAVTRAAEADRNFALIDLSYEQSERIRLAPPPLFSSLASSSSEIDQTDVIGPGDTISVSIFEPGGALFGGGAGATGAAGAGAAAVATAGLPPFTVAQDGAITLPFAGRVRVAGLTSQHAERSILAALRGKVVSPQVVVSLAPSAANGVTVIGQVNTPGRIPLTFGASTILDVVAAAGGVDGPPENVVVNLVRDGQVRTTPLVAIYRDPRENIRLLRGDQINLVAQPRRYSSFGAVGAVTLTEMPTGDVTLTAALSALGGLDTNSANARSVFVFRFERPDIARSIGIDAPETRKGVPVIYRLNLAEPAGFFTANNFIVQPDDIVYVPRANSAELRKFFEFVQSITRVIYDVTVTGALGVN